MSEGEQTLDFKSQLVAGRLRKFLSSLTGSAPGEVLQMQQTRYDPTPLDMACL